MLNIVFFTDINGVFGQTNSPPLWNILYSVEDFIQKNVIVGMNTFRHVLDGKAYPNKNTIVLSRKKRRAGNGIRYVQTLDNVSGTVLGGKSTIMSAVFFAKEITQVRILQTYAGNLVLPFPTIENIAHKMCDKYIDVAGSFETVEVIHLAR